MDDNERLARALGSTLVRGWVQQVEGEMLLTTEDPGKYDIYQSEPALLITDGDRLRLIPPYAQSLGACAEAEAEIARRGLIEKYTTELLEEVNPEAGIYHSAIEVETHIGAHRDGWSLVFAIATAPPDVRVRAMLKVLEG
jgi:hypothetical protein